MVRVEQIGGGDPMEFEVVLGEGEGAPVHRVTLAHGYLRTLSVGDTPPARVVEASFLFLLDREPKESIMQRFDLPVISRYFPEFETTLPEYIAGLHGPPGRGEA